MSQTPTGTPYNAKYKDPTPAWIRTAPLPGITNDQRQTIIDAYDESRIKDVVIRFLEWLERHDVTAILTARVGAVMLPILLSYTGYPVGVVVSIAAVAVIVTEWVDQVRTHAEREQLRRETMRQYNREVEKPRIRAEMRDHRRRMRESDDVTVSENP